MRIMVLGANGYLGWPTVLHLTKAGHEVYAIDDLSKQTMGQTCGAKPIGGWPRFAKRIKETERVEGAVLDVISGSMARKVEEWQPDAIVHYAEQPSAPYSMRDSGASIRTMERNIRGTMNILWAIKDTDIHLVKLGTMGEYGTPNIDIEEGWLDVEHNGRKDRVLYPKKPGSWYHVSKVCDSTAIEFACRAWGIRATDLNQGVVYGTYGGQTTFYYDAIFGTALNRFIAQAVVGHPLTVYGDGSQTRGWLNIEDTIRCVELACTNPADPGEFRVFNQFTEQFSVLGLANLVAEAFDVPWERFGAPQPVIEHIENPRVEQENHYYNAEHTALEELGLQPTRLTPGIIDVMLWYVDEHKSEIDESQLLPKVTWR